MCKLVSMKTNFGTRVQVADIKKKCIENIVNSASACEKIEKVILFGSSLDSRCREESDIDIAVVCNVSRYKLFQSKSYDTFTSLIYAVDVRQDYDILPFSSEQDLRRRRDAVCQDILQHGQVIYRKEVMQDV